MDEEAADEFVAEAAFAEDADGGEEPGKDEASAATPDEEPVDAEIDEAGAEASAATPDEEPIDAEIDESGAEAGAATPDEELIDAEIDEAAELRALLRGHIGDWYVVHSYAGYENRVKANLETARSASSTWRTTSSRSRCRWSRSPRSRTARRSSYAACGCPVTCWSAWTSPTRAGAPCGTPPA